jgi:type II restriction/modification system DNA methylase subunit YeeA
MNTKTFAQQSRALLMEGVANKLLYWGFNANGSSNDEPNPVPGGYTFRGKVFDDETVPKLWKSLQQAIRNKGIEVVKEEAAYTWFNRMMALQIMSKNDYMEAQLAYVPGMSNTPQILQKARQGQYSFLSSNEQERLKRIITDFSKEQEAFALLLVGYCHSNKILNSVFGRLDDYTELLLPDNMLQDNGFLHLLNTTDAITDEQYKEVELIGWLYQFYISERKDEVFASFKKKKKAEAKDIPAATQIFTPNWIVKYMVQNTVGKIWLDKNPKSKIKPSLKYLVENDSDSNSEPIISEVSQLTLIDPAAGSGHILVEGFDLLYKMYLEEYYTPEEAVESILKNNLFGLDIDDRAAQLANFAILLKAAKQFRDVFTKGWLPNVYAMPEYATFSEQEIQDFLGADGAGFEMELKAVLRLMEQAKNLGSVIKVNLSNEARTFIEKRFEEIKITNFREFNVEIVYQKIKSFIPVLLILSNKYAAVVANPPYMGQKNMNDNLKSYVSSNYPLSKADLFAVFMESTLELSLAKGFMSMINQHSWMFLSSFEKLRERLIKNYSFVNMLHLGPRAFEELSGEVVQSTAFVIKKDKHNTGADYFRLVDYKSLNEKEVNFLNRNNHYKNIPQTIYNRIPSSPIAYWITNDMLTVFESKNMSNYSTLFQGIITGNNDLFVREWFEINFDNLQVELTNFNEFDSVNGKWVPYNKGGKTRKWYGNQEKVVNFSNKGRDFTRGKHQFSEFFFKSNFSWSYITGGNVDTRFFPEGFLWDVHGSSAFPNKHDDIYFFMSLISSKPGSTILNILNPTLSCQVENIAAVPVIYPEIEVKKKVIELVKECISISRSDWNAREISWDFQYSQLLNGCSSLKTAIKKYQIAITKDFFNLHSFEEELNRIFIQIYGLIHELTPEVALKDITILQDELKQNDLDAIEEKFTVNGKKAIELPINNGEVISQFISYAIGLFMGRYRLDKPGLNIAHPNPTKEELSGYTYNHGEVIIDQDAILPIMGKNCNFNDDIVKQFTQLLDTIWGHEQRTENINFIQECLDKDLEKFIVNDFWKYHCDMYKKTPIYWLFSSKKGAFQVLVYMHRMNEFTVEKIRANYLLEHLKYLKSEIAQKEANASNLSTAEAKRLDKLRNDLRECEQYDMALKNVADQQIKFDLNDGVSKNYELFETVVAKIK